MYSGVDDAELHCRPSVLRHREYIALGRRTATGDQPNFLGQKGQWLLARRVRKPFGRELFAQGFDAGKKLTDANVADIRGPQTKGSAAGIKRRLAIDHHAVAVLKRRGKVAHQICGTRQLNRFLLLDIAQRQIRQLPSRLDINLGQLTLDPQESKLLNPPFDLVVYLTNRPRCFWGIYGLRHV